MNGAQKPKALASNATDADAVAALVLWACADPSWQTHNTNYKT
jgi:hypothetical protein